MRQVRKIVHVTVLVVPVGAAAAQPVLTGQQGGSADAQSAQAFVPPVAGVSNASPLVVEWGGTLTQGENLAFAVINGDVRFQAPVSGDLPLTVSGVLVAGGAEPSFTLTGSFTSPTRSYTFDVFANGFADSLTVTPDTIVIAETRNGVAFDLVLNRQTGLGSFSYTEDVIVGGVELTRSASGTIGSASVVPSPAAASLLLGGSALVIRRRRGE